MSELHINKIANAINNVIDEIKTREFEAEGIILFGSAVRNELKPTSDVDVCIVLRDGENHSNIGGRHCSDIMSYFCEKFLHICEVDYVFCHIEDLKRQDRVFKSIVKEGRMLWQPI